jgi:endonuclease/exonuclease/phosphatase family metal-dependent hydrolase
MEAIDMPRVRAVTFNLWGEQEPLEHRMALCIRQLQGLSPDVVALQEVRDVPGRLENQAQILARALSFHYVFARTVEYGGGWEGLAILSRAPISDSGHIELPHGHPGERRILLWARIEVPSGTFMAYSIHLNYRMQHGVIREDQVAVADAQVQQHDAPLKLLMGDFNATPDSDEIRFLRGLHTLHGRRTYYQDAFLRRHPKESGLTWSHRNPFTQRLHWLEPDRRLDYIFVSPLTRDGRGVIHECRVVLDTPDGDGTYPSDHLGVFAEVQLQPLYPSLGT